MIPKMLFAKQIVGAVLIFNVLITVVHSHRRQKQFFWEGEANKNLPEYLFTCPKRI